MEITILGTSCMVPTRDRNHQSIFIRNGIENILIDCGEGTQRQLKIANINPNKINKILITHLHGDHVLGLPGLLQTISSYGHDGKIEIYGPKGTRKFIENLCKTFNFIIEFDNTIEDISKKIITGKNSVITSLPLEHGVPCVGYSIKANNKRRVKVQKLRDARIPDGPHIGKLQDGEDIEFEGRKISFSEYTYVVEGKKVAVALDTLPCKNIYILAKDSDLFICETSYDQEYEDKAKEYYHMTSQQAAQIASQSNVKKLIITHFSQRYKSPEKLVNDAKMVFQNVEAAYDFMKVNL